MRRLRTTSLAILAALAAALAGSAGAHVGAETPGRGVPQLLFPVVGPTTYRDDFGEPRARWSHPGNDLVAARRTPVVAVEDGTITLWSRSRSAGCMIYLYGESGTTYEYIHLNNDAGAGNDNRGGCVPGVAYGPGLRDGQRVISGQLLGFVGDSGDADGAHPHLHFEVRPGGGGPVSPYPYLQAARRLAELPALPRLVAPRGRPR